MFLDITPSVADPEGAIFHISIERTTANSFYGNQSKRPFTICEAYTLIITQAAENTRLISQRDIRKGREI